LQIQNDAEDCGLHSLVGCTFWRAPILMVFGDGRVELLTGWNQFTRGPNELIAEADWGPESFIVLTGVGGPTRNYSFVRWWCRTSSH